MRTTENGGEPPAGTTTELAGVAPFRPLADVSRIDKVGRRAGIQGHLPEDNRVPRANFH
jgi:hypothetical protein